MPFYLDTNFYILTFKIYTPVLTDILIPIAKEGDDRLTPYFDEIKRFKVVILAVTQNVPTL